MPPSSKITLVLPKGVHKVPRKLAGGRVAEHWYAWRGGPNILSVSADNATALQAAITAAYDGAIAKFNTFVAPPPAPAILDTLITRFLGPAANDPEKAPPHLGHLSKRSIADSGFPR